MDFSDISRQLFLQLVRFYIEIFISDVKFEVQMDSNDLYRTIFNRQWDFDIEKYLQNVTL